MLPLSYIIPILLHHILPLQLKVCQIPQLSSCYKKIIKNAGHNGLQVIISSKNQYNKSVLP